MNCDTDSNHRELHILPLEIKKTRCKQYMLPTVGIPACTQEMLAGTKELYDIVLERACPPKKICISLSRKI